MNVNWFCFKFSISISAGLLFFLGTCCRAADTAQAVETPDEARARHEHVARRRAGVHVICHRGAVEFAHENTLEAFRAALELGADGNEFDIRATKDGVLVCFHDDMLDHLLEGYGDVSDWDWAELQRLPFRSPGRFGKWCRIPTLREVFELHRAQHGLMFLDVKRPGLIAPIGKLLEECDLWDHVVHAPPDFTDARIKRTRHKVVMYEDRTEVDDAAIANALKKPGERILLEYPQQVALALGRNIGSPSLQPVREILPPWVLQPARPVIEGPVSDLLTQLNNAEDWNRVAAEGAEADASAARILRRAQVADELARRGDRSENVFASLELRVRRRSLHRDWRYCGLDGCAALRALIALRAPSTAELARFCLWRDDPAVETAMNPMYKNPRAWTDFRTKLPLFRMLESMPGAETEALCRDYLALTDDEARRIGIPLFEDAARCLLAIRPHDATIEELEKHRLSAVRGRARLAILNR